MVIGICGNAGIMFVKRGCCYVLSFVGFPSSSSKLSYCGPHTLGVYLAINFAELELALVTYFLADSPSQCACFF